MKFAIIASLLAFAFTTTPVCEPASVPTISGVCVRPTYIEGCYSYATATTCAECVYNYKIATDGKCQYLAETAKPCCRARDPATGLCQTCEVGLFLENGKCVSKPIVGCLNQDSKANCINCAKGFLLENGTCKQGIVNCASHLTLGDMVICDQCEPGNSLMNNNCLPNSILGCKDQVGEVCNDCYDPFFEKNNHCEVPNCKSHNEYGCVSCECGFYLTPDRKCSEITQGCIRYNRGVCSDCMQHFKLKGGICDIEGCLKLDGIRCVQCDSAYDSTELGCKLRHCLISKEGVCETCDEGYLWKDGECIQSSVPKVSTI